MPRRPLPDTSMTGEPHLDVRLSGWAKKAGEPDPAAYHEHALEAGLAHEREARRAQQGTRLGLPARLAATLRARARR